MSRGGRGSLGAGLARTSDRPRLQPTPVTAPADSATAPPPFSEKEFYLEDFHGKTLAIAAPAADLRQPARLAQVIDELTRNETNVVLLSTERSALEPLVGEHVLSMATPRLEGTVWRQLRASFRLGLVAAGSLAFAPACREATLPPRLSNP